MKKQIEENSAAKIKCFESLQREIHVQRDIPVPDMTINYCAIFGTLSNQLVDAKSNLAVELI